MIETLVVLPRSREIGFLDGDSPFSYPSPPLVERLRVLRPYCGQIVLIAGHNGESTLETGEYYRYYKVHTGSGRLRSKIKYARTVRQVVANEPEPTILNFDPNLSGALFALLGKLSGARLVTKFIGLPGSDPDRFRKNFAGFWLLLRFSDESITISPYCEDVLREIYDREITVVPNRVSDEFRPIDLEPVDHSVLYVGRFDDEKRVPLLIDAFADLTERCPEASLLLAGGREQAGYPFQELVEERGIEDRTRFLGRLSRQEVVEWMNRATVLALSTAEEGFGMVVLEAMACGTPVVGADSGSIPWVVDGGGIIVDPTDTRGFAEVLLRVLTDESLRTDLVDAALERAADFPHDTWGEDLYMAMKEDSKKQ